MGVILSKVFESDVSLHSIEFKSRAFFERMLVIRTCELKLLDLFAKGKVRGTLHTCLGQEACAVGVISALNRGLDVVCSNHRGHGHYLAYCGDVLGLIAEVMGFSQGVCGGVGGSQHLHKNNFYTNGILGGMPPVAVGMAAAEKFRKTGAVVVVFLGDGAMAEGSVYEALNLAALLKLPILFAVEHNQYAQSTPATAQHAGKLEDRAPAFGVPVTSVDGNDVMEVYKCSTRLLENIRSGHGPAMLFMHTYRLGPHSKGDDVRDMAEIESMKTHDPIRRLQQSLATDELSTLMRSYSSELDKLVDVLSNFGGSK